MHITDIVVLASAMAGASAAVIPLVSFSLSLLLYYGAGSQA